MKKAILMRLLGLMLLVFFIVLAVTVYTLRFKTLEDSKRKAQILSELVRDTLTSYMVMGVIDRRDDFLSRIREIEGVEEIRVIRAESVIEQFGSGMRFELPKDELERAVLRTGRVMEHLEESFESVKYRIVIPYRAEPIKGINCLECHRAKPGETLGAISLSMDLTPTRSASINILLLLILVFLLALSAIIIFVNTFMNRINSFINELIQFMKSLEEGSFNYEVKTDPGYEANLLKEVISKSLKTLHDTLNSIEEKVISMIGYGVLKTGNVLSDTSKIVDELLNIYKFKRVVEKDRCKRDVYERIREVLEDYMSLDNFCLYEVNQAKNRIDLVYAVGFKNRCNEVIFENAEECRAKRTGATVDSREFPCICPNFGDNQMSKEGKLYYYCIPVYVGGAVGNVLQLIYEREMEPFINLVIPYIRGYLNEAAPVLEARTYMDILREQSLKDQLTGLYNRRFLEETIDKLSAQIKRRGTSLGILMVDVDYFKQVNDTYGHDVGDRVLKSVADVLQKNVRESDIVIRFGGEEFMVLLMDVQAGRSEELAEKIRKAMENHTIEAPGVVLKKTISIGVSEFPVDSDRIWQCIKFADVALYKAKEMGRNRVVRFRPEFWQEESY